MFEAQDHPRIGAKRGLLAPTNFCRDIALHPWASKNEDQSLCGKILFLHILHHAQPKGLEGLPEVGICNDLGPLRKPQHGLCDDPRMCCSDVSTLLALALFAPGRNFVHAPPNHLQKTL